MISLAMFGLGACGSLANLLMRRGMTGSSRCLWSIALAGGVSMLGAGILGSRFSALEVLIAISLFPYLSVGLMLSRDDGVLFVYRPARDILRVLATATASLRALGVEDPQDHFAIFGASRWVGATVTRSPLPLEYANLLSQRLAQGDFGGHGYFIPGVRNIVFKSFIDAIAEDREREFLRSLPVNLSPTVDDRPSS